jgi:Coenzyme PQQ synthesis protein D (PqqD)
MTANGQRYALASRDVVARVIDGEAIIINLATGLYYSTRGAGAVIWEGIETGQAIGEIVTSVCRQFSVRPDVAEGHIRDIIGELLKEELIRAEEVTARESSPASLPEAAALSYEVPSLTKFSDMAQFLALDPPLPSLEP